MRKRPCPQRTHNLLQEGLERTPVDIIAKVYIKIYSSSWGPDQFVHSAYIIKPVRQWQLKSGMVEDRL